MNDIVIIEKIKKRDESAIEYVINKYSKLLWSVASKILGNTADDSEIEECVADVFISLWKEPEKFEPERSNLKNYLCLKAKSKAIDRFRSITRHMTEELTEESYANYRDLAEDLSYREDCNTLKDAVDSLGEPAREIIIRRYFMDQKPAEIADVLGLTAKQVINILYRSKEKLRGYYEKKI